MVRTVLTPENTHIELDIPVEYVGKKIEITYLALDELHENKANIKMSDFWGVLSNQTASELNSDIDKNRKEWERDI